MRRLRRVLLWIGGSFVVAALAFGILSWGVRPEQRPALKVHAPLDPARIERGRYLSNHVLGCIECHSARDWTRFGGPVVGAPGAGGDCWGAREGVPGKVCASNITPDDDAGIGAWTDGEVLRAIREGVDREGEALFPSMPFTEYAALSDEDALSVVAYLRTLEPDGKNVPPTEIDFPFSYYIKLLPRKLDGPVATADGDDEVAYGEYLATVGGCRHCHSPIDSRLRLEPGREFSGGREFRGPFGVLRSPNLTSHQTGLGAVDRGYFVKLLRKASSASGGAKRVDPSHNTIMPWIPYGGMSEADASAIFSFLRSVQPKANRVLVRPPRAGS